MALPLIMTKEEIAGMPQSFVDREADADAALTKRLQMMDASERGRRQECDEVKRRFDIELDPLSDAEDYAELAAKHLSVGTRMAELDEELREANLELARGISAFNKNKIERRAQDIIDGVADDASRGFEEMRARSARLESELSSHVHAKGLLWSKMQAMRSERSIDAVEAVRPAHRRVVTTIAEACERLLAAIRDEQHMREIVTNAGFDNRLPAFQSTADLVELELRARAYVR